MSNLKLDNQLLGQALLSDEQTLVSFSKDFGKIHQTQPIAVFSPIVSPAIEVFLNYANDNRIPVTIRGKGLSQGGQSLALEGGIILSMENFTNTYAVENDHIWMDVNATWSDLLAKTLPLNLAPAILPYNCNLSIGGVLSAGGIGASSFKVGPLVNHVDKLEVIDAKGSKQYVDKKSTLFQACLGGQGRVAVMTKANIKLRNVRSHVKTDFFVYNDMRQWFEDIKLAKQHADYMELFCTPSIQGAALYGEQRRPLTQWLYGMHLSYEFDSKPPKAAQLNPWKQIHSQTESISSYLLRHNPRFAMMKKTGQWDQTHPWYECFLPEEVISKHLEDLLELLPPYFANLVHIVPIAKCKAGFTMFPETESIYEFMILNPGIVEPLKEECLKVITKLDEFLLSKGGKRYLSGYIGRDLKEEYWQNHFGERFESWVEVKNQYDPNGIFSSHLFRSL